MAWRLLFTTLKDPTNVLGELPYKTASMVETLNDAAESTIVIPLRPNKEGAVATITDQNLNAGKTAIYGERDGRVLWGGVVWVATPDVDADTLTLACGGFHSYFRRRKIRIDQTFSSSTDDQLDIARALIDYAQAQPGGSIGITTTDSNVSGRKRDRTYRGGEGHHVGVAIDQLAAVDDGFDFRYDSFRNSSGDIETAFRCTYPTLGRSTNHVFELGVNIIKFVAPNDGTMLANQVDGYGSGEGANQVIGTYTDTGALAAYPLLEASVSHLDVTRVDTLVDYARRRVTQGLTPNVAASFTVVADKNPKLGAYEIGDQFNLRAQRGWLDINSTYRLTSRTIAIADTGGETISLTAQPLAQFA